MKVDIHKSDGTILWNEEHLLMTNSFGLVTFVVGTGPNLTGIISDFSRIEWSAQPLFLRTWVKYPVTGSYTAMGSTQILSVPYSLVAKDVEGPLEKLDIKGADLLVDTASLFEVKNKSGNTVFAVYPEAVRVYVAEGSKGAKGGFAVGSFGTGKTESQNYLMVSKDSTRIYLDSNPATKTKKGGFAVGGYDLSKGLVQNYLDVSEDSVRVFIDNNPLTKSKKGGFAVGGYDMSKGTIVNFFDVATDTLGKINPSQNRLLWYPQKNAFLTGKVLIERPDSVGVNSFASGYESKAVGDWSQALGFQTAARGNYSTSIGKYSVSKGANSFAFGNDAKAVGDDSYALGTGAIASGPQSFALGSSKYNDSTGVTVHTVASATGAFALGFGSVASNSGAFAIGVLDTASGAGSLSMGYFNKSIGWFSTTIGAGNTVEFAGWQGLATGVWTKAGNWAASSFGDQTYARGHTSFATGFKSIARGHLSSTFGEQTIAQSKNSMAIGAFNYDVGDSLVWHSWDPVFMVGVGTSIFDRKNGFTVYKNGNIAATGSSLLATTWIHPECMELNYAGTGNRVSYIDFHGDDYYSDYGLRILRMNSGANSASILYHRGTGDLIFDAQESASMVFLTASTEKFRIRNNGNVGIGVSIPGYKLEVSGTANLNAGYTGAALLTNGAQAIWFDGTYYSWGYGGSYNVFADPVTIGGTYNPGAYFLNVNGNAWTYGSWASSDIRWKKNINDLEIKIDNICQLKAVSYEWRTEEFPENNFDSDKHFGLIAQDVEKIFPDLVKTDQNGYKAVAYDKLSVILLEGMKDQQQQIESQNEKIKRLEKMIEQILSDSVLAKAAADK